MEFLKTIVEYFRSRIAYSSYQKKAAIYDYEQQIRNQYNTTAQLALQDALFQVLGNVNIAPSLCTLNNPQDLMPQGYKIMSGTTVYYYGWCKSSSSKIASSVLHRYTQRMNTVILTGHNRFIESLRWNDEYTQLLLIQEHGILYNGFKVITCKDDDDMIILAVTFV